MSYESMGANTIFNLLNRSDILMVTEGLNVFKVKLPSSLAGKSLAESGIRSKTGCSVVAIDSGERTQFDLDPYQPLAEETEIILIGNMEAENSFFEIFGNQ